MFTLFPVAGVLAAVQQYSSAQHQAKHIEDAVKVVAQTFRSIFIDNRRTLSSPPTTCHSHSNWEDGINVVLRFQQIFRQSCVTNLFFSILCLLLI